MCGSSSSKHRHCLFKIKFTLQHIKINLHILLQIILFICIHLYMWIQKHIIVSYTSSNLIISIITFGIFAK